MLRGSGQRVKKCLVLLSGGADSATLTYWMRKQGYEIEILFFDFGNSLIDGPRRAAKNISIDLCSDLHQVRVSLWSDTPYLNSNRKQEHNRMTTFCNVSCMMAISMMYAASLGIKHIAVGIHAADIATDSFALDLMRNIERMGRKLLQQDIRILTPFSRMNKASIIKIGLKLGVPYKFTWSCGKDSDIHCGKCADCKNRQLAFAAICCDDPTQYKD